MPISAHHPINIINTSAITADKLYCEYHFFKTCDLMTRVFSNKITNKSNLMADELVKIINDLPDLSYYKVNNQRVICSSLDENKCLSNPHCVYNSNNVVSKAAPNCSLALTQNKLLNFRILLSLRL